MSLPVPLLRVILLLAGLLVLLTLTVACVVEPEIAPDDIDVTLDAKGNPFNIESSLTVPQKNGDADVLVSYPAVTHLIGKTRGPISRIPGRVIGWRTNQVEVIYPGQGQDEYIKVWVAYGDDFDPADLHDDKQNIASCRFAKIGGGRYSRNVARSTKTNGKPGVLLMLRAFLVPGSPTINVSKGVPL